MMEANETNRPLTEVPVDNTPETTVVQTSPENQPEVTKEDIPVAEEPVADVETPAEAVLEPAQESDIDAPIVEEEKEETTAKPEPKTKDEIIERLKEIDANGGNAEKAELDTLKVIFYKLHKAGIEAAKKAFEEKGDEGEFVVPVDEYEEQFKSIMASIKEKRNTLAAADEKEQAENLARKIAIIERIKALTESQDDANKSYNEFKKLQQEWKEIKHIPANKVSELWRNYQLYTEKFYDLIKLNNEFREYDFKKNLEIKTRLCEAAEKLANEPDVISAFHQLQKLHQEFRETGPIVKDLREQIWTRFKAASTAVNRRHQQYFDQLKEQEQTNLDAKTVICEIVEGMEFDKFTSFRDWNNKTQEVLALQAKWKTIGYAPRKMNVKIFERFRTACDEFFKKKAEYFKKMKDDMNGNLEKKRELAEKAEALKDSTDWKKTAEQLAELQKQWKEIGPVSKKHSDALWKRFIEACDYFFDQRNKATSSQHNSEIENLKAKKEIIQQLNELEADDDHSYEAEEKFQELMKRWNEIGHVPFREKDKIYKQYHNIVDNLYPKYGNAGRRYSNDSRSGNKASGGKEKDKLTKLYENMRNEIQTYENNLGFLSASSKKGNGLVDEMKKKVEKLKAEAEAVLQKIQHLDEVNSENE